MNSKFLHLGFVLLAVFFFSRLGAQQLKWFLPDSLGSDALMTLDSSDNITLASVSDYNLHLYSYTSEKKLRWNTFIHPAQINPQAMYPLLYDMKTDRNGDIYICGACVTPNPDREDFIIALDSNGNLLWTKSNALNLTTQTDFNKIQISASGAIYVVGHNLQDSLGAASLAYVFKFNNSGNTLWSAAFKEPYQYANSGVLLFTDGSILLSTDNLYRIDSSGHLLWNQSAQGLVAKMIGSNDHVYLLGTTSTGETDSQGNFIWKFLETNPNNHFYRSITYDGFGNIYICGDSGMITSHSIAKKFNSTGQLIWTRHYWKPAYISDTYSSIINTSGNRLIFAGNLEYATSASRILLAKMNINGDTISSFTYQSDSCLNTNLISAYVSQLMLDRKGSLVGYGSAGVNSGQDCIARNGIFKFDTTSRVVASSGPIPDESDFYFFPNPASLSIHLHVALPDGYVEIRNLLGQQMESFYTRNHSDYDVDVSKFEKGIYFITVQSNGHRRTKELVLQ